MPSLFSKFKTGFIKRVKYYSKFLVVFVVIQLIPFEWFTGITGSFNKKDLLAWQVPSNKLPIVYNNHYNIDFWGLEKLHPFDSKKYLHVYENLHSKFGWNENDFISPALPTWDLLSQAVSSDLFWKLQNPLRLTQYSEVAPVIFMPRGLSHLKLVNPMKFASLGSVLAAKTALQKGWAINLGGGYHHASSNSGGGFCLIPDISLIIKWLRDEEKKLKRVMIIDLDAHQGNGHERDFINDPDIYIFDMFNKTIYPHDEFAKQGIDYKVELDDLTADKEYLAKLEEGLANSFNNFAPELIIFNAGTDILSGDPLGSLMVSAKGVIRRDEMVFKAALEHKVPIVMLLSGGYQKSNATVIADSVSNIWSNVLKKTDNEK